MKIAYVVTRAEPVGGAQIHIRDLAVSVQERGHFPTVITSGQGPFIEALRAHNIPTILLEHFQVPIDLVRDARAFRELHATLKVLRPDLVTAHSSKAGFLSRLVGKSLGIPVVFTAHGWAFTPGIPGLKAGVYRRIERLVGPLASRIITVSEFDRQLAVDGKIAAADRIVAVHNGMPDVAPDLRAEPGKTPVRLVMVARFEPQKDHPTLLRALAQLQDEPWELDLIGEGPRMAAMRTLASELGIEGRVRFTGQTMEVAAILAGAQVFLLISNWEGFPLSILEGMRAGLPVIASAVGGIAESVRDEETGFLVPRGDVEAVRGRIEILLRDSNLRMRLGANGRRDFERRFTLDHSVRQTLAVYEAALGGVRSPSST